MPRVARALAALALLAAFLAPPAPSARAAETMTIAIRPPSGPIGTVVTVTGRGAPPNAAIELWGGRRSSPGGCAGGVKGGQGNAWPFGTATADSAGNFVVTTTMVPENYSYLTMAFFNAYVAPNRAVSSPRACFDFTDAQRTFPETGKTVRGDFLWYWDNHGGLALNGYPLSEVFTETLENGKSYLVQYFERVRMEYHDDVGIDAQPLLGAFGRRIHPADPPVAQVPGATYFTETGHNVTRAAFADFWTRNGGLRQFGYPISEELTETLNGQPYTVQYFERARFEWHPENPEPYRVQLGQFGRQICGERCR